MSFIQFESGTEKEKIRQELRDAREELLKRAQKNAEVRAERKAAKHLRGEDTWIHPDVLSKIKDNSETPCSAKKSKKSSKKSKKEKKSHKSKKEKKRKKKKTKHSSTDESSSSEEERIKKKKRKRHDSTEEESSGDSEDSNAEDEWIEKSSGIQETKFQQTENPLIRDDWMTGGLLLKTYSKDPVEKKERQTIESYDPKKCSKELNPYWRDGGTGLPTFQRPKDDDEDDDYISKRNTQSSSRSQSYAPRGNWRKKVEPSDDRKSDDYMQTSATKSEYNSQSRDHSNKRHLNDDRKNDDHTRSSATKSGHNSQSRDHSNRRYLNDDRKNDAHTRSSATKSEDNSESRYHLNKKHLSDDRKNDDQTRSSATEAKYNSHSRDNLNTKHLNEQQRSIKARAKQPSSSSDSESDGKHNISKSTNSRPDQLDFLTDQQMNELGAKILKAEIMGDTELAKELNEKLSKARELRNQIKSGSLKLDNVNPSSTSKNGNEEEHILLTTTDSKGNIRPLHGPSTSTQPSDPYGRSRKGKRTKTETHVGGERVRYFPDDDRYDIKQMFEREKYTTAQDVDAQFAEIAGKHKNPKDDLEDVFADKVRRGLSDYDKDEKEKSRAIREHEQFTKMLENCDRCFESSKMEKQLIVCMGSTVYLSLPWHEGLQAGHCLISPIQHISCSTQLDEDTWSEVNDFRAALTRMFRSRSQDVIFFETARYLQRRPHMVIHCVPSKDFEMAPFYFKKAIQESEQMWSTNKQLISLKDTNVRRAVPKGLPYFWVHFGTDSGLAHVIEDQERFPSNFAQEIIGGLLNLDARSWRKPRREYNPIPKVKQFADMWKKFDCTKKE